jgi:hypothetical protein
VAWVAGLATIGAVEFMAAAVALFILRRLQVSVRFFNIVVYNFLSKKKKKDDQSREDKPFNYCCFRAIPDHGLSHAAVYVNTNQTWPTIRSHPSYLNQLLITHSAPSTHQQLTHNYNYMKREKIKKILLSQKWVLWYCTQIKCGI